jgi:hypothetical protein
VKNEQTRCLSISSCSIEKQTIIQIPDGVNNWQWVFRWPCVCWRKFVHRSFEWHTHARIDSAVAWTKREQCWWRAFSQALGGYGAQANICAGIPTCWARVKFCFTMAAAAERVFCCCSCAKGLNTHATQNKIIWAQRTHTHTRRHPISFSDITSSAHAAVHLYERRLLLLLTDFLSSTLQIDYFTLII